MRITCHITSEVFDITLPEYKELTKAYGNEDNISKYYIQPKFATLLKKGVSIDKIIELFQLPVEDSKAFKDVVKFHKNTNLMSSVEATKASHLKSDRSIKTFLKNFAKEVEAVTA